MSQSSSHKLKVRKIKAHQNPENLWGAALWEVAGNAFADISAKRALDHDHQFLREVLDEISEDELNQKAVLHLFQKFLLDLSLEECRLKQAHEQGQTQTQEEIDRIPNVHERDTNWLALTPTDTKKFDLPPFHKNWILASSWPPCFTIPLWEYLSDMEWQDSSFASPGVSGIEILVDFVVCTSCLPPIRNAQGDGYVHVLQVPLHAPTTIRAWVQTLLESARQISRICRPKNGPKSLPLKVWVFLPAARASNSAQDGRIQEPRSGF